MDFQSNMFKTTFYSSTLKVYLEIEKFYSYAKFLASERISLLKITLKTLVILAFVCFVDTRDKYQFFQQFSAKRDDDRC